MSNNDELEQFLLIQIVSSINNMDFSFQCFKSVMLYSIYAVMFNGMPIIRHYHLLIISMPTSETALQNLEDRVYTLNKNLYHFILDTLLKTYCIFQFMHIGILKLYNNEFYVLLSYKYQKIYL